MDETLREDDSGALERLDALAKELHIRLSGLTKEMERVARLADELAEGIADARNRLQARPDVAVIPPLAPSDEPSDHNGMEEASSAEDAPVENAPPVVEAEPPVNEETVEPPPPVKPTPKGKLRLEVWVDGSCLGNPGYGGWAYLLKDPMGRKREKSGAWPEMTTNNRMEIQALIEALTALLPGAPNYDVKVVTDSKYLQGLANGSYKAKQNQEMVAELRGLIRRFPRFSISQVLGHTGIAENERVDTLARTAAQKAKDAQKKAGRI